MKDQMCIRIVFVKDGYSRTNGATSPASTRPTVDSLLDQLSTDLPNG